MKIGNDYQPYLEATHRYAQHGQSESAVTGAKDESVTLDISTTSQRIRSKETSASVAENKRLADIKQAIQAGTYHVEPNALTDKLLEIFKEQRM